ncbi:hypothetical protein FRC03_008545, partial [Tulasnella sp. 419]
RSQKKPPTKYTSPDEEKEEAKGDPGTALRLQSTTTTVIQLRPLTPPGSPLARRRMKCEVRRNRVYNGFPMYGLSG